MLTFKKNIGERKELAQMLAELIGQRSVYTRAPLYAYQVGAYMVDRDGDLHVEEADAEWEILNLLIEEGYILPSEGDAEGETATEENTEAAEMRITESTAFSDIPVSEAMPVAIETEYEQEIDETDADTTDDVPNALADDNTVALDFMLPITGHTGTSLRNLVYLIYSRAPMLNKATGANFRVDKALVNFLRDDTCTDTVDAFRQQLANYEAEHGSGMEGLVIDEDTVTFRGFAGDADNDHMTAYGHLTTMMNKMAITQKRIQAKSVNTENEKYGFRIWLLRLGMNGDEFKVPRKLLMKKLDGHTAFRTPEEAERARKKALQKRAELREKQSSLRV